MTTDPENGAKPPPPQREPLTPERIRENLRKGAEARRELEREIAVLRGNGSRAPARGVIRWR